jgi:hypothetical protein
MTDKEFHKSNQMFLAMIKKIKREGLDATKHHPHITDGDLEKLKISCTACAIILEITIVFEALWS